MIIALLLLLPTAASASRPPARPAHASALRPPAVQSAPAASRLLQDAVEAEMDADPDRLLDLAERLAAAHPGSPELAAIQPALLREFRGAREGRRRTVAWLERVRQSARATPAAHFSAALNASNLLTGDQWLRRAADLTGAPAEWAVSPVTGDYAVPAFRRATPPECARDGLDRCSAEPGWRRLLTAGGSIGNYRPDYRQNGVVWAVADIAPAAPILLALNGGTSMLYVDGFPALTLSNFDRYGPSLAWTRVEAGRHHLAVKLLIEENGTEFTALVMPARPEREATAPLSAGLIAEALGDDDRALEIYTTRLAALGVNPRGPEARALHWRLAALYRSNRLQLFPERMADDREREQLDALAGERPAPRIYMRLAELAETGGDPAEATRLQQRALALRPGAADLLLTHAELMDRRGFPHDAWQLRREAEAVAGGRESPLARLAAHAAERGELRRLDTLLPALAEIHPDAEPLAERRRVRDPRGHLAAELARWDGLPDPQHEIAQRLAGMEADEGDDPATGLARLERAYSGDGGVRGPARALRARLLARLGRFDEARAAWRELAAESGAASGARAALAQFGESEPVFKWRLSEAERDRAAARPPSPAEMPGEYLVDWTVDYYYPDRSRRSIYLSMTRVLSAQGVEQWSKFKVPEGAELIRLQVRKPDGRRLQPGAAEGDEFLLPDVEVGDIIETEYFEDGGTGEGTGALKAGSADNRRIFLFNSLSTRTRRSEQYVVGPGLSACKVVTGNQLADRGDAAPGHHFLVEDPPRLPAEPNRPPDRAFLPWAGVNCGSAEGDTLEFWEGLLAWRTRSSAELRALADRLAAGTRSDDEKITRLFRHLREEVKGEWVGRIEDPTFILNQRTGNRLLPARAILQLWGIPHEYWLVAQPEDAELNSDTPSPAVYGSTQLLRLTLGGEERFISLGSEFGPVDLLPGAVTGAPAVVIDREGRPRMDRLPALSGTANRIRETRTLDAGGIARVDGVLSFSPLTATQVRGQIGELAPDKRATVYERVVQGVVPGLELEDARLEGLANPDAPLEMHYRGILRGATAASDGLLLPLPARETGMTELGARDNRTLPLWLGDGNEPEEISILLIPPEGWRIEPGEDLGFTVEGVRYRLAWEAGTGGALTYRRDYRISRARLKPENYPAWAEQLRAAKRAESHRPRMVRSR